MLSLSRIICIFNAVGLAGISPACAGCELWFLIVYWPPPCHHSLAAVVSGSWLPRDNADSLTHLTIGQTGLVGITGVLKHGGVWAGLKS